MLGTVLPLALVVGLSPLPILPAVLLLMTPRARGNGAAYLAAWLIALTTVVSIAVLVGQRSDAGPATDEGIGWIQVVTGAVFLVLGAVKWLRRPRPGDGKEPPAWLAKLDSFSPRQSARLGALLAAGNPKNLVMAVAAGAEIALLAETPSAVATGVVGFVVVGSLGVGIPIIGHAVLGERASAALERARAWLERNSTALSVGVLVVLGILLVSKGLGAA